jgi:hypothetical protein
MSLQCTSSDFGTEKNGHINERVLYFMDLEKAAPVFWSETCLASLYDVN